MALNRGRHLYSAGRPSLWALAHILVMAALWNRAGHYIFALWFLSFSFFCLFSSPNLSGRRLDAYHTSTHGVTLVQISNACVKCAACSLLEIQDAFVICHFGTIAQLCRAISSQLRHVSTIGKNLLSSNTFSTYP